MQRARYVDDILVPVDLAKLYTFTSSPTAPPLPKAPRFWLPPAIPAKARVHIKVHGRDREVSACVARALEAVVQGKDQIRLRPETLAKLRLEVPELDVRRDISKKVQSNCAWYVVG